MKYYELNPDSPFYHLMQDTTVEDSLSDEEKERIVWITRSNLVSVDLETEKCTPDEEAYIIYAALNDIPQNEAVKDLLANELGKEETEKLGF